ncbi:MAG: PHP domain-containing protein [Deltaproteobacteria bacterium]|nr:MAG: PHP domain-containing protein [Deltaproteobacteria bacterium]
MRALVDLHLHSLFSDGILTPTELVAEAASLGLRAIALADHDNVDGVPEALAAGLKYDVEIIPAVELSVQWEELSDIHLLGYAFDHKNAALQKALAEFRDFRAGRSERILVNINQRLTGEGRQPLDYADVAKRAGGTIGRPHIGQALLAAGFVKDMEEAFTRYLVPCNEPKRFFPLEEAIKLIHDAGGCTVLAHPVFIGVSDVRLGELLDIFIGLGLDGVEAYSSGTTNDGIDRYITMARRRKLIVTGGSDFHQPIKGGVEMGKGRGNLKIPYRCVEEIRDLVDKRG